MNIQFIHFVVGCFYFDFPLFVQILCAILLPSLELHSFFCIADWYVLFYAQQQLLLSHHNSVRLSVCLSHG